MIRRRTLLTAASGGAALPFAARSDAAPGVTGREMLLGQSAVLNGPLGVSLMAFNAGASLAFDDANAKGGVNGRNVRLITLDDNLDPVRTVANYRALLDSHKVFAFFGGVGSATIAAVVPLLRESGVPLIGNYAVADAAREQARGSAYFLRATYDREAEKLVQHLGTIGIVRIAVAHLANPGGVEVLGKLQAAVVALGQAKDLAASAAVKNDGSNVAEAARTLAAAQPQAVVLFVSGPPVAQLMQMMWDSGSNSLFYGMSTVSGNAVAKVLGQRLRGLAISQVVSYPWSKADPTALEYRRHCEAGGLAVSYAGWEGYLNALLMMEGLRRVGPEPSRAALHAAMRGMKTVLAGMSLDFTGNSATGSRYVELVHVGPDGRFLR